LVGAITLELLAQLGRNGIPEARFERLIVERDDLN